MMNFKCLIVDDEELGRMLIENYVQRLGLTIVAQCRNPIEALKVMQTNEIDLIFLDIQMPEMNGLQFIKSLNYKPLIILTTAYAEHALESYTLDVVDYLLKPIRFERFTLAVNKAMERYRFRTEMANDNEIVEKGILLVKSEHRIHRLKLSDILFIQSMSEYVSFHLSGSRILSLGALKSLENELPANLFLRVHKSYIVAIDKIDFLDGNTIQVGKEKIPVGPSYKEQLLSHFNK
jgi:DNA-binding LytR/AlgR family response regulator